MRKGSKKMIINGKEIRERKINELIPKVEALPEKLTLAVIQVGNIEESNIYIAQKQKMCNTIGYLFKHIKYDENVEKEELINKIKELNNDKSITGILIQLPLPKHMDEKEILNNIDYRKDVDGLTDINAGKLLHNKNCLVPCTPLGITIILKELNIDLSSKNVVIVGRSNLVGKPLANILTNMDATVTLCHSKTKDLSKYTKNADILISCTGKKFLIKEDMIKKDSIIIDVGITRDASGSIKGDVDFDNCKNKAKYITPVPGGVGPLTVTSLALNLYNAYMLKEEEK